MNAVARCLPSVSALALAVSTCAAQVVWPPGFGSVRGNAVMNAPFTIGPNHTQPTTRWCVVIDAGSLPFPPGTVLSRISFRRDTHYTQGYGASSGQLTVRLAAGSAAPGDLNDVQFGRLLNGLGTAVYASTPQAPFTVPAASAVTGSGPAPFNVVIPFQHNYTWTGGPLAIEILWTPASGTSTFRIDAIALPRRAGSSRTIAGGCTGSNGYEPTHFVLPETTSPGATLQTQLEGSRSPTTPLELIALHVLGVPGNTVGFSVPLAAIGGVPGCYLQVDPVLTQVVTVSNPSRMFARALSATPLPATQTAVGTVLHSQWLCFDTSFGTALPLTASDVQAITLGPVALPAAARSVRTWWRYGAAPTSEGQEAGRMVPDDYGPVIRFN
jgi:hypothetical protein